MAKDQAISRGEKGEQAVSDAIDVSGLKEYVFSLDADDAAWGTLDPKTKATADIEYESQISQDEGKSWRMVNRCTVCIGARGKDGGLPTMTVYWTDRFFDTETKTGTSVRASFPSGTLLRLLVTPLKGAIDIGAQGEGKN